MQVLVFCRSPGALKADRVHPAFRAYEADAFTDAQLRALLADPIFTVAIGEVLTAEGVEMVLSRVIGDADVEGTVAEIETLAKMEAAAPAALPRKPARKAG